MYAPSVVSILIGVNDTWRRYDAGQETSAVQFRDTYDQLLTSPTSRAIVLVLMTPFLVPVTEAQRHWKTDDLDAKIGVTRLLAKKYGAVLVDLDAVLTSVSALEGAVAIAEDGVHPTRRGHELIASAWSEATRKVLSEI